MLLSDLLRPESVIVPLESTDRESSIVRLVDALGLSGRPPELEQLKAALLAREAAGSTGIGNGLAIPHARTKQLASPRLAIGRTVHPIDFNSADGKPVTLIFLLAVPESDPKSHLRALAALSRLASDKKLLRQMNKVRSSAEFYALVAPITV